MSVWIVAAACGGGGAVRESAESAELRLVFGGDVMFGRMRDGRHVGCGGPAALEAAAPVLRAADLALVNLESPLCDAADEPWMAGAASLLVGPLEAAGWLAGWGIDAVSLANNHALDCGEGGLVETRTALEAAGVGVLGFDDDPFAPRFFDLGEARVAVIAATDRWNVDRPPPPRGLAIAAGERLEPRLLAAVEAAENADVVIVFLHWGRELVPGPDRSQRDLARALIDAGATLVVGHGSHVFQAIEPHGDGLIAYSLGNLLFDMTSADTSHTALLDVTLEPAPHDTWRIATHSLHPFTLDDCALATD